jgi:hypothetical protein
MPIRPSNAPDVDRLIAELRSGTSIRRETAAARLAIIGSRATEKLHQIALDDSADADARVTALHALEAIGDPRSFEKTVELAETSAAPRIVTAAIAVIGSIARSKDRRSLTAFEWLTAAALRQDASDPQRLGALAALGGLSARQVAPIYAALRRDPNSDIAARAARQAAGDRVTLERISTEGLPVDPVLVSSLVREEGHETKVTALRLIVDMIRAREHDGHQRAEWMAVRGQLHQVMAERGSRLALYDVRETLERAGAAILPVGFLSAAAAVGGGDCLAPLAAAWVASAGLDRWWTDHLADAFRSIVTRERLRRRDPRLVRILEKWPAAGVLVAAARKK